MSISDLIKNKFVEEFTAISVGTLLTTLLLSFALGLFVLVIYRVTYGGVSFSKSFALSLVMLSMVTSLAILTVRSNVVLSLGMVGALSIVRFRTASQRASRRRAGRIRMRMPLRTSPRATDTRNAASI